MEVSQQPSRTRRCPEDRPAQILDAALEAFGQNGLAGTRLDDIARLAGLSKGTIYLYFTNKDDLFREVIRGKIAEMVSTVSGAIQGESGLEKLRSLLPVLWSALRTRTFETVYRLIYAELNQFPDLTQFYAEEVAGQITRLLAEVLREGMETGEFRKMDPIVAARMVISLYIKHAMWCNRREMFPSLAGTTDEQVQVDLEDFCLYALRPEQL